MDFPNKIFLIILCFVGCVLFSMYFSQVTFEAEAKRLVLNEMDMFLDKVTDKASITQADLDDLYLAVASTGATYDVDVNRLVLLSTQDEDGSVRTIALNKDFIGEKLQEGDVIQVIVSDIGLTPVKRLKWLVQRVDEGRSSFSLSATVGG